MKNRDELLVKLRPEIDKVTYKNTSKQEIFQNSCLRPIIVLQRELLIAVFKNYFKKHKNMFFELTAEKRLVYIENAIQRDMKLRNSLKGMIIGMFSLEEYLTYTEDSSAINKRMMHLVKGQIQQHIQVFEKS
ncbi:hypothetical protein GGR32_002117 [Mesonia hippocampi]|uniref:Glyoxalase n=1 Tax=Mesonia hippocampi TaxID=1628250 RepID=A0A840ERZ7_9FLAO|nr:glyoxalase [Mesonia hippocampi]MBB4119811.1 hypothetical protein [Mesonia hippocampi]